MSFYNMLFGKNPHTDIVLALIGLRESDTERFRDCGLDEDGIWIRTRTGGGNREDYPNEGLTGNPYYLRDEDDDFDYTYATYYFCIPSEIKDDVKGLSDPAQHGLSANLIAWLLKTLQRPETEGDKRRAVYERQMALIRSLQVSGELSQAFNGHTIVPLSDSGAARVLAETEKDGGEFIAYWNFLPFKLRILHDETRYPKLDAKKPLLEQDMVRVGLDIIWEVDEPTWERYRAKFAAKYPLSIGKMAGAVEKLRK